MNYDCVGYDLSVKENPEDYMGKYVDCCGYIRDHPDGPVVGVFPSDDFKVGWQPTLRRSKRIHKPIHTPDMLNTLFVIPDEAFYKRQRMALRKSLQKSLRKQRIRQSKRYKKKQRTKYTYIGFNKSYVQK